MASPHAALACDAAPAAASPSSFHPAVSTWLHTRFGQPTPVQAQAWAVTVQHRHALIAAPTGSGKTLAAFLSAINDLVLQGLAEGGLPDAVQVLYVSPLKALSNDIRANLQEPLAGIADEMQRLGLPDVGIRTAVRTGDTPATERERMRRTPPHILVTTPESLYILLTSAAGRGMLGGVRTVIVDELHAVAGSKRGAHLMLTLERLEALRAEAQAAHVPMPTTLPLFPVEGLPATVDATGARPLIRIGLSATVKPLDEMARFLIGARADAVAVIDTGHVRQRDIALELPRSPLSAVMSGEVWEETYDRLAELVDQHRTTLVFVNQRRVAERAARHLADRLGEQHVAAHHGSLAREHRLQAEQRLKAGNLRVLVATSSLELGIDIGDVDLVCQLGSPRSINAFLQRVGRSGHAVGATPKGRLFPLALEDLLESAALLDAVARGELDRIHVPPQPLDALAQQIVAEVGCRDWPLDALYQCLRRAAPYGALPLPTFEAVVQMLAEGYTTRRGRRGAYLHLDAVNRLLHARKGAKLAAVTNAGVIPDQFDYDVVLLPDEHRVGTLNEDFAFESLPGDIFQLGNTSYRIAKIETGKVYVEDAKGQPPTMPFWFGEGLGRTEELSTAVGRLFEAADAQLDDAQGGSQAACERWLMETLHLNASAAQQLAQYLGAARAVLGGLPTQRHIIFERFFDEVGDTHLVIHSPYGSRINKAWGLALRKRFCRQFNFELQASALEDSIVLSLGPTHSFPLDEVKHYLKPATAVDVLVQALLAVPMFTTRWRWNATAALAIRRMAGGRKVPPQFQRSDSEDLLTVVFPDQVACAENLAGDREVPDHPLVAQTVSDCLHVTMDADGFLRLLAGIDSGAITVSARDVTTPSPLSHAVLNARPYAFLDDGEAEERRTKAVRTQSLMDVQTAADMARLDLQAIAQVCEDAQPDLGTPDELHDALMVHGFLTPAEAAHADFVQALGAQRRVTTLEVAPGCAVLVAAERLHEFQALWPQAPMKPAIAAVRAPAPGHGVDPDDALREILRGRLELLGPVTAQALGAPLGLDAERTTAGLLRLEAQGAVMRGDFTAPGVAEWCDRRLLARMHRATRDKLRAEFQSVPAAQYLRFLCRWHRLLPQGAEADGDIHHAADDDRRSGETGLLAALAQLEGVAAAAGAWEEDLLSPRVKDYAPEMLDRLCATGRVVWWRPAAGGEAGARKSGPIRATPVLLCERIALPHWQQALLHEASAAAAPVAPGASAGASPGLSSGASTGSSAEPVADEPTRSGKAQRVLAALREHGASFFNDLQHDTGLLGEPLEQALAELVAQGLVTCDSFAGLRVLVMPADERRKRDRRRAAAAVGTGLDDAGRWSLARRPRVPQDVAGALADPHVEHIARVLLQRYGVVFRKLLEREDGLPPWRELHYVLRRLEARGEARGGRFVNGFSGEQFALPEAALMLRAVARTDGTHERFAISAADPLNLAGILTPGDKVPRLAGNRLMFENGVPIATYTSGDVQLLRPLAPAQEWAVRNQLIRRHQPGRWLRGPAQPQ